MVQDTKKVKTEIITALDSLPLDSLKLLAKFVAFLKTNVAQEEISHLELEMEVEVPQKRVRVLSPRLAHPEQAVDFTKEVTWETSDDSLRYFSGQIFID